MKKLFLPIILLFLLVSSVAFADFVQPGIGWLVEAPNVLMPSGTTDVCQSDGVTCSTIGAASGATTALDNLPILEQIEYYETILAEKEEAGEGLTITLQKIEQFKSQLK